MLAEWVDVVEERKRIKAVGYRLKNAELVAAFNSWVEARVAARRLMRTMRRITLGSFARSWNTWAQFAYAAIEARAKLLKAAQKWQRANIARVLHTWVDFADERSRKISLLKNAAVRMANMRLVQVMEAWIKAVSQAKLTRQELVREAVNRMGNRMLTVVFYAWRELLQQGKSSEAKMLSVKNMWGNRVLVQFFNAWVEVADTGRMLKRKAVARFLNALQAQAFAAWVAEVQRRKHVYGLLKETHNRWANRVVVLTFRAWADFIQRKADLIGSSMGRWAHASVARAFDQWKDIALEGRRLLDIGRRVLKRYTDPLLSRCYLSWVRLLESEDARRDHAQRVAMSKMSGRADIMAQLAFQAWQSWAAEEAKRRAELAAKFFGRYLNQQLAKVFLAWQADYYREGEAKRGKSLQALQFLSGRQDVTKRLVLEMWLRHTADRKQQREDTVLFALRRIHQGIVHVCFLKWLEILPDPSAKQEAKEADSEQIRQLKDEVITLRAQLGQVSKQLAMQERAKAYRWELQLMRDELHSFLFQGAPPPQPLVNSDSQSDVSADGGESPTRHRPATTGSRPKSGGPTGLANRQAIASGSAFARPASARVVPPSPAAHEWAFRPARRIPPETEASLMQTAAGAATSTALRAHPPSSSRPATTDRGRSPRVRNLTPPTAEHDPHFTCSTIRTGAGGRSGAAGGSLALGLAWSDRSHFSQHALPPIS